MKRIICAAVLLALLCGCVKNPNTFRLNTDSLSTKFHSKIDGSEFEGYMAFDKNLNMIITFTYPDNINGFSLTFTSDAVISSVDNVDDTYTWDSFTDNFAFLSLYKALKNASLNGGFGLNKDSAYEMTDFGVTVVADKHGSVTSARVKNGFFIFGL